MPSDKLHKRKQIWRAKGNVSLTTVILVGALLIVSGMGLLANAIDITLSTKSYFNRMLAESRISTCVEEAMYKLAKNPPYTGPITVAYSDGNCQVQISNIGGDPTKKNLQISATIGQYTVTKTKKADTTTSPMSVTN